jgi:hypothetical protein
VHLAKADARGVKADDTRYAWADHLDSRTADEAHVGQAFGRPIGRSNAVYNAHVARA